MKVLFVAVEVAPFAKVGGLADVVGSLPKALRSEGHDVRIVMPLYRMIEDDPRWALKTTIPSFDVHMNRWWSKPATFKETTHEGVPVGFIGTDEWFTESVDSASLYQPGGMQHLFLSAAVLKAMEELDWIPDVIHCHDWHMGFLPAILREKASPEWDNTASVFTIHNHAYQGEFGVEVLDALGLAHDLFHPERVEAWGRVNFLKTGCIYANQVNTVSETYACEIQTREYGETLEGLMAHLANIGHLSGIVNGIDPNVFDPSQDAAIPANFSAEDPRPKTKCTKALRSELGLVPNKDVPLVGMISRLSSQKGYDLVAQVADQLLDLPIQLVILALGDPAIADQMKNIETRHPGQFRFIEKFDTGLAQRIYAGCNAFLMPSRFEPCGLGQLIAMRYGTVPIVRATGGLADTVHEGINGFTFDAIDAEDMLEAVRRMVATFKQPMVWREMMLNGMVFDSSWAASAKKYIEMYERAIAKQRIVSVA